MQRDAEFDSTLLFHQKCSLRLKCAKFIFFSKFCPSPR